MLSRPKTRDIYRGSGVGGYRCLGLATGPVPEAAGPAAGSCGERTRPEGRAACEDNEGAVSADTRVSRRGLQEAGVGLCDVHSRQALRTCLTQLQAGVLGGDAREGVAPVAAGVAGGDVGGGVPSEAALCTRAPLSVLAAL